MSYGVPIPTLAQRLIRMGPPDYGYHLERLPDGAIDAGLAWMRDWHDIDGRHPWQGESDASRRRAIHHWGFLRWLCRVEWQQRGGRDV